MKHQNLKRNKKTNPCCNILVYPYAWSTSALSLQSQPASCCSGCQHPWQPNPSFQSPIRLSSILCIQVKHALWILLGCSFVGQMLLDLVYRRMMLHVLNSNFRAPAAVQPPLHYRTVRWFLWRRQTCSASWQLSSSRPLDNSMFSNLPPLQTSPMAVFPSLEKHVLIQTHHVSCPVSLHQELRLLRVWCKNQQSWAIIFLRPQRKTVVYRSLWWQSNYNKCTPFERRDMFPECQDGYCMWQILIKMIIIV